MRPRTRYFIAIGAWLVLVLRILLTPGGVQGLPAHVVVLVFLLILPVFLIISEGVAYIISFAARNNAGTNDHFDKFTVSVDDDEYEAFKEFQRQRSHSPKRSRS